MPRAPRSARAGGRTLVVLVAAVFLLAVTVGVTAAVAEHREPSTVSAFGPSASTPSPSRGSPPSSPSPSRAAVAHPVVLIVLENKEYGSLVGSSDAPYINDRLIPAGRLFTNYDAVSHPSLPNYLAMTSGSTDGKQGTDSVTAGEIRAGNLFHQLWHAHLSWRAFQETMPSACYAGYSAGSPPNQYALKHDPAMTYANVAGTSLCAHVVPLERLDPANLPAFGFITPNLCNDMHSCSVRIGDAWLANEVPPLRASGAIVIVTVDEGSTGAGGGGHVLTVEVGPGIVAGTRNGRAFNHYGLLAGLENHFGLARRGHAATARPLPI